MSLDVVDANGVTRSINTINDLITYAPATQTTAAAILAKLIAAPSTAANQATIIAALNAIGALLEVSASEETLTEILAKLDDPATQTTLAAVLAALQAAIPAGTNRIGAIIPAMDTGGNVSAQTAATGTNWTSFGSQAAKQLTIVNDTGTKILVRQGGAGVELPLRDGAIFTFYGLSNINTLAVKRADESNSQVVVTGRWEA